MHLSSFIDPFREHDVVRAALAAGEATLALAVSCAASGERPRRIPAWAAAVGAGAVLAPVGTVALVASGNAGHGLVVAVVVLAAGAVAAEAVRRAGSGGRRAGGGLAGTAPAGAASAGTVRAVGAGAGAGGGPPAGWATVAAAVLLVPGAALLAWWPPVAPPGPAWVRAAVFVVTVLASPALWSFDRRHGRLTPVLLLVTLGGIYATTPDTEQVLVLLAAAAGVAAVGWWPGLPLGTLPAPVVAGLVAWAVAVDGRGRHSAVVGGLACLGLLVAEPLALALRRRPLRPIPAPLMLAAQLAVVGVASRLAGLRATPAEALAVAAPALALAVFVLAMAPGRGSQARG